MEAESYRVPRDDKFVLVEFPGGVSNPKKAIEMIGGSDAVSREILGTEMAVDDRKKTDSLILRFRPGDPISKGAKGKFSKNRGLIAKIKRRRNGEVELKPLGVVEGVIAFDGMMDFQFSSSRTKQQILGQTIDMSGDASPGKVDLVPRAFDVVDVSYDHRIKGINPAPKKSSKASAGVQIGPSDPVPRRPNGSTEEEEEDTAKQLRKLFSDRPSWTRHTLRGELGKIGNSKLNRLLEPIAYGFTKGAFRRTLNRFGYDPREVYQGRLFQPIDYRPPHTDLSKRNSESQLIQLCDLLHHKKVADAVNSIPQKVYQNEDTGFFSKADMSMIRRAVSETHKALDGREVDLVQVDKYFTSGSHDMAPSQADQDVQISQLMEAAGGNGDLQGDFDTLE